MKRFFIAAFALTFALLSFSSASVAGQCGSALKAASVSMAKDKNCQKDARNVAKAFGKQIKICKGFRNLLKACRKAKRASKKECRQEKRACKKKCKKGKKGKACRKACRKAKRACKKAARKTKRACKKEAKTTQAFKVCKDARKLTRKAGGKFFKCAWKHYKGAAATCGAELAASLSKN